MIDAWQWCCSSCWRRCMMGRNAAAKRQRCLYNVDFFISYNTTQRKTTHKVHQIIKCPHWKRSHFNDFYYYKVFCDINQKHKSSKVLKTIFPNEVLTKTANKYNKYSVFLFGSHTQQTGTNRKIQILKRNYYTKASLQLTTDQKKDYDRNTY